MSQVTKQFCNVKQLLQAKIFFNYKDVTDSPTGRLVFSAISTLFLD